MDERGLEEARKRIAEALQRGDGVLSLRSCHLDSVPVEVWSIPGLTTLDLAYNRIGAAGAEMVAKHLAGVAGLTTLDLTDNRIGAAGAKVVAEHLKDVRGLTTLYLASNRIGDDGAKVVAEHLKDVPGLTTLDLRSNGIGPAGARAVAEHLKDVRGLTTLDLGYTAGDLATNRIGAAGAKVVAEHLKDVRGLTTLDLSANDIGDDGARAVAGHLKDVAGLTTLDLGGNGIYWEGARAVAEHLKDVPSLTTLDLSSNVIFEPGARAVASRLKDVAGLTSLNLDFNFIDDNGARAVAEHLKDVPRLVALDLGTNRIGDDGARAVAEHLKEVPGLTALGLAFNSIRDEGARAVAEHLKDVPDLTTLDLASNELSTLDRRLALHPSLRNLSVRYNPDLGLPPQAEDERDPRTLFQLWEQSRAQGSDVVRECKVQLLGGGHNGKTSLSKVLLGKEPPRRHDPTQSFERAPLELSDVKAPSGDRAPPVPVEGGTFIAWLFDYGGQSHLHGTHRFFLADQRNIWVVLLRSTHKAEDPVNRLSYWLGMVRHEYRRALLDDEAHANRLKDEGGRQAGDLPRRVDRPPIVLLLETWSSEPHAGNLGPIDAAALSREFGLDVRFVSGLDSLDTRARSDTAARVKESLRKAITDCPELWRVRMPKSFIDLRAAVGKWVADDGTKIATTGYWRTLLEEARVDARLEDIYLRTLRDLGVLLYVGDRDAVARKTDSKLRTAIFNPAWVKDPVYRVLWGQSGQSDPAACVAMPVIHAWLQGQESDRGRLEEASARDDVLALMEECGIVHRFILDQGRDGWLVPDHLLNREHEPPWQVWTDSDTRATSTVEFLPDYALLPLMAYWRAWITELHLTSHRQLMFAFHDGSDPGVDRPSGDVVRILLQTDPAKRAISCSLRGGALAWRERALTTIRDEFRRRVGLRLEWDVRQRPVPVELVRSSQMEPMPDLAAALAHFREGHDRYGLASPLQDDFVAQLRKIFEESKELGPSQKGIYRALNVALLVPVVRQQLQHAALTVPGWKEPKTTNGRLSRDSQSVRSVLDAVASARDLGNPYWECLWPDVEPDSLGNFDALIKAYQRALDRVPSRIDDGR